MREGIGETASIVVCPIHVICECLPDMT